MFFLCMQLWQLETLLLQKDTYLNYSQALSYTSQALSQNLQGLRKKSPIRRVSRRFIYYLQENWRRLWVLTVWVCIMIGLFTWKFFQYKQKDAFHIMGYCLPTAKGGAETLKFNMALILLPVCRNTITWLRSTKLSYVVPFDDNINFHKVRIHTTRKPPESGDYSFMVFSTIVIYFYFESIFQYLLLYHYITVDLMKLI